MKNVFRTPTAIELAQRQLDQAERDLLYSQARAEEWAAQSNVLTQRCTRLRRQIEAGKVCMEFPHVL